MHIAMIIDDERLCREHGMYRRLAIGLMSEGLELTRIIPQDIDDHDVGEDEQKLGLAHRIAVNMNIPPWLRPWRRQMLLEALDRHVPDVIFAAGDNAWKLALELGRSLQIPVALEVWSAEQLNRLPAGRSTEAIGAYVAATEPIADELREHVNADIVGTVPFGVSSPEHDMLSDPEAEIRGLGIIGTGRDMAAYRSLLTGISRIVRELEQVEVFVELRGPHEHDIWRQAERLNLLEHFSSIPDAAHHRSLLVQCHGLVMPERYGDVRSLTLDVMAHAVPVVAAEDPFLDYIIPDRTAFVADADDPADWARLIRTVLRNDEPAPRIAPAARQWVLDRHQSSRQAELLANLLRTMHEGQTIRLEPTQ